ncbi:hypothetical protein [Pedobacter sp. Leaf170]|uniref:hypothetical protein n=1 Tax=Pedobacter sp. Leaf170 TaxID=2876558 RepID=UPI001E315542|nr:hypothetical protein [Pedobacter sp. Leaf170]
MYEVQFKIRLAIIIIYEYTPNNEHFIRNLNFYLTKPKQYFSVLLLTGLTNFWGCNVKAEVETSKQKFSAGNFVSFVVKRKKPVWPRQATPPALRAPH